MFVPYKHVNASLIVVRPQLIQVKHLAVPYCMGRFQALLTHIRMNLIYVSDKHLSLFVRINVEENSVWFQATFFFLSPVEVGNELDCRPHQL